MNWSLQFGDCAGSSARRHAGRFFGFHAIVPHSKPVRATRYLPNDLALDNLLLEIVDLAVPDLEGRPQQTAVEKGPYSMSSLLGGALLFGEQLYIITSDGTNSPLTESIR